MLIAPNFRQGLCLKALITVLAAIFAVISMTSFASAEGGYWKFAGTQGLENHHKTLPATGGSWDYSDTLGGNAATFTSIVTAGGDTRVAKKLQWSWGQFPGVVNADQTYSVAFEGTPIFRDPRWGGFDQLQVLFRGAAINNGESTVGAENGTVRKKNIEFKVRPGDADKNSAGHFFYVYFITGAQGYSIPEHYAYVYEWVDGSGLQSDAQPPAPVQRSERLSVSVVNNTSYSFGVNIKDKSWMINPRASNYLTSGGSRYGAGAQDRIIIVCNQRGFRREYTLSDVARKGANWTIDLAGLIQDGSAQRSNTQPPAPVQRSEKLSVYVVNNTSYYFGVNIKDKSWMVNPWARIWLKSGAYGYGAGGQDRIIIVCNQRGFRREYTLNDVARKGSNWTIDLAGLIQR